MTVTQVGGPARSPINFTIYHGLAASAFIHALVAFGIYLGVARVDEADDTLVVEFQGVESSVQAEEILKKQTLGSGGSEDATPQVGASAQQEQNVEKPPDAEAEKPSSQTEASKNQPISNSNAAPGIPGLANQQGEEQGQSAQIIRRSEEEQAASLKAYIKMLSKRIQKKLIYPGDGHHAEGVTTVSFRIRRDGEIHSDSLAVVVGSGKEALDASALKTIRASAPFAPPPEEITVRMAVIYARKR